MQSHVTEGSAQVQGTYSFPLHIAKFETKLREESETLGLQLDLLVLGDHQACSITLTGQSNESINSFFQRINRLGKVQTKEIALKDNVQKFINQCDIKHELQPLLNDCENCVVENCKGKLIVLCPDKTTLERACAIIKDNLDYQSALLTGETKLYSQSVMAYCQRNCGTKVHMYTDDGARIHFSGIRHYVACCAKKIEKLNQGGNFSSFEKDEVKGNKSATSGTEETDTVCTTTKQSQHSCDKLTSSKREEIKVMHHEVIENCSSLFKSGDLQNVFECVVRECDVSLLCPGDKVNAPRKSVKENEIIWRFQNAKKLVCIKGRMNASQTTVCMDFTSNTGENFTPSFKLFLNP